MPMSKGTICPSCGAAITIDIKQNINNPGSSPYYQSETGECITTCPNCDSKLLMEYSYDFSKSPYANGNLVKIDEEDIKELKNSGIDEVVSILTK